MTEDATPTALADGGDPTNFTNDEVNSYLASVDPEGDEYRRVIDAERDGQARVGIVGKRDANGNWSDALGVLTGDDAPPQAEPRTTEQTEAAAALGAETVDVVLMQHWTDADGQAHAPGDTVTVPATTALTLLTARWAVKPEDAEGDTD